MNTPRQLDGSPPPLDDEARAELVKVIRLAMKLVDASRGVLSLSDAGPIASVEVEPVSIAPVPLEEVIGTPEAVDPLVFSVSDVTCDPHWAPLAAHHPDARSVAGAVLFRDGRPLGYLLVVAQTPIEVDDARREALGTLADLAVRRLELEALRVEREDHRRLAEVVRAREAELARAQAIAHVGSWEYDIQSEALRWSDETYRIFGFTDFDVPMHYADVAAFVPPEDQSALEDARQRALAGEPGVDVEHRLIRKDGSVRWVIERGERVDGPDGPRLVGTIADITERKLLEREFIRAQRMESVGTLASGLAHDLNNVLAPILMAVDGLRHGETDPDKLADIEALESCAERGASMVRQLLSFARGDAAGRSTLDLAAVLRHAARLAQDTFPKLVAHELELPSGACLVDGDAAELEQLFVNLCVNARDAMPHGGRLKIGVVRIELDEVYAGMSSTARPGTYWVAHIEDTGIGMPPEVLERIFEPFFTTKGVGEGTGLGLSSAHAIARRHGGFILVSSAVGHGSRFDVYLPALTPPSVPTSDAPARAERQAGASKREGAVVLVVDDEEAILRLARRVLERAGHQVLVAEHGAAAIALFAAQKKPVDVVITDMSMPVMDGPATIAALRAIAPDLRIIASSGVNTDEKIRKARAAGVTAFLAKPYTGTTLLQAVERALAED